MSAIKDKIEDMKREAHKELCEREQEPKCEYCSRKLLMKESVATGQCSSCRGENNIGVSQATENTLRSNEDYREYMKSE